MAALFTRVKHEMMPGYKVKLATAALQDPENDPQLLFHKDEIGEVVMHHWSAYGGGRLDVRFPSLSARVWNIPFGYLERIRDEDIL